MRRKVGKIVIIALIFAAIVSINYKIYAISNDDVQIVTTKMEDVTKNPNNWKPDDPQKDEKFEGAVGNLLGTINVIGVIVSVIVLIVIGIKYMLGSIEEKAEYKKTMIGYIIGAIMVMSMTTLPNIIYNVTKSLLS